jgi:hypothetical protein
MVATYARLYCGRLDTVKGVESKFGYRHIKDEHKDEWEPIALQMGRGWQDVVGWMMDWVTYDPDMIADMRPSEPSRAQRFCYDREFYYLVDGREVLDMRAVMLLGETGRRIMTFFPSGYATSTNWCRIRSERVLYVG